MLYKGDVEFKKVIEHFSDGSYDGTSNTHVTLNKYLNAMKIFGLKVRKHDNKYTLTTPLYKINFDFDDLYGLERLKKASEILPKGKSRENFKSFVRALEIRFDDESKNILEGIRSNIVLNPSFSAICSCVKPSIARRTIFASVGSSSLKKSCTNRL